MYNNFMLVNNISYIIYSSLLYEYDTITAEDIPDNEVYRASEKLNNLLSYYLESNRFKQTMKSINTILSKTYPEEDTLSGPINDSQAKDIVYDTCIIILSNVFEIFYGKQLTISLETFDKIMQPLYKLIEGWYSTEKFRNAIDPLDHLLNCYATFENIMLLEEKIKALDVYNKPFIVQPKDLYLLKEHISLMIKIKKKLNCDIKDTLLKSNVRFCVIYDGLNESFPPGKPKIVKIPEDIFKFLMTNNYDPDIIRAVALQNFEVQYNYVDIFKKILKTDKSFKDKLRLVSDETNIWDYMRKTGNPVDENGLIQEAITKLGYLEYNKANKKCIDNSISSATFFYRVLYQKKSMDDAIKLGIIDRDRYNYVREQGMHNSDEAKYTVNDVFYAVAREYMKGKRSKDNGK